MSSFAKCFDVVSMVVDEATAQFAPIWRPNNEKLRILKQYCGVLDSLAEGFGGVAFAAEGNPDGMSGYDHRVSAAQVLQPRTESYLVRVLCDRRRSAQCEVRLPEYLGQSLIWRFLDEQSTS